MKTGKLALILLVVVLAACTQGCGYFRELHVASAGQSWAFDEYQSQDLTIDGETVYQWNTDDGVIVDRTGEEPYKDYPKVQEFVDSGKRGFAGIWTW